MVFLQYEPCWLFVINKNERKSKKHTPTVQFVGTVAAIRYPVTTLTHRKTFTVLAMHLTVLAFCWCC